MDQGFTKPSRNSAGWDSDINANFTRIENGFYVPAAVGSAAINTGQLVTFNTSGLAERYNPISTQLAPPDALALQVASPGNTSYFLAWGAVSSFTPWSGQLVPNALGGRIGPSVRTPGWVTTSLDQAAMFDVGRVLVDGTYIFNPKPRPNAYVSFTQSGIAHAASAQVSVFSFTAFAGPRGINVSLRVRTQSIDNYRVTFYSNSARTVAIYDTIILSGNLGVRTIDMTDNAMWPYSLDYSSSDMFGIIYGAVEVLSSAATALNSGAFSVDFIGMRTR